MEKYFNNLSKIYSLDNWWPAASKFEIMVGAILTQNTNWSNVEKAITNLKKAMKLEPLNILNTSNELIQSLIYPSGYYKVKTRRLNALCEMIVSEFDGSEHIMQQLPWREVRTTLLDVNGIGPETADDILLYALHKPVFIVDQYTRRIFSRLGYNPTNDSYDGWQELFMQSLPNDPNVFKNCHSLIVQHAQNLCRKIPICEPCPLKNSCQFPNSKLDN